MKIPYNILFRVTRVVLILGGLGSLFAAVLLLLAMLFNIKPYVYTGKKAWGLVEYSKGVPVKARSFVTLPDSTFRLHYESSGRKLTSFETRYKRDLFQQSAMREGGADLQYADTILLEYRKYNGGSDEQVNVMSAKIDGMTLYMEPQNIRQRVLYYLPLILKFLVVAWGSWQLYRLLHSIVKGQPFRKDNAGRLLNIGWGIVLLQLFNFAIDRILADREYTRFHYESTIPNWRPPFDLYAQPEMQASFTLLTVGLMILILGAAFRQGAKLQRDKDLTI